MSIIWEPQKKHATREQRLLAKGCPVREAGHRCSELWAVVTFKGTKRHATVCLRGHALKGARLANPGWRASI